LSFTVTVNEQLAEFKERSDTEYEIVVVPRENVEPEGLPESAGTREVSQLSVTVGVAQVAVCVQIPTPVFTTILEGQGNVGDC